MLTDLLDRLRLEHPVIQAGMGGGISGAELAGAVSAAGGLGTVGTVPPPSLRAELSRAREIAGDRPIAANLLMPFIEAGHVDAVLDLRPEVVVIFFGNDRDLVTRLRDAGCFVLQQIGTVAEAEQALEDGVDGLIAQGRDAGGHLLGTIPTLEAVPRLRAIARNRPVLAAGGIADHHDVRSVMEAGADAAVAGTRFLLTSEARAHPGYQQRVLAADRTVETELFGFGWPQARHRVIPNAATARWVDGPSRAGPVAGAVNRLSRPLARRLSSAAATRFALVQRPWLPVFSPQPPLLGMPDRFLDAAPLYAGESARRIDQLLPASDAVAKLAGEPDRPA